jgi:hypothetical protein
MNKDYNSQLRNEQNGPSFSPRQIDKQNESAERRQEEKEKTVKNSREWLSEHNNRIVQKILNRKQIADKEVK